MKTTRLILRILCLPFFFAIQFIWEMVKLILTCRIYILYGVHVVANSNTNILDSPHLSDLMNFIEKLYQENKTKQE